MKEVRSTHCLSWFESDQWCDSDSKRITRYVKHAIAMFLTRMYIYTLTDFIHLNGMPISTISNSESCKWEVIYTKAKKIVQVYKDQIVYISIEDTHTHIHTRRDKLVLKLAFTIPLKTDQFSWALQNIKLYLIQKCKPFWRPLKWNFCTTWNTERRQNVFLSTRHIFVFFIVTTQMFLTNHIIQND